MRFIDEGHELEVKFKSARAESKSIVFETYRKLGWERYEEIVKDEGTELG